MIDQIPARYPVICGPTAGGKTALALAVAEQLSSRGLGSEIVSADAYLVYQGLDIGTAKPTAEELAKVPHHLVDIVLPTEGFTLAQWLASRSWSAGRISLSRR